MRFKPFVILSLKVYTIPLLLLVLLVYLRTALELPIAYFTRDPVDFAGHPFYLGIYSNINMVVWGVAVGVLWFTFLILKRDGSAGEVRNFILTSAITTTLLYLDDFFQLHERVFPDYLGVPQVLILAIYALWTPIFLLINYRFILKTEFLLFFSAIAFLGASVLVDYFDESIRLPAHHIWEDGTKFLGIVGWCVYFIRYSYSLLKDRLTARPIPG